MVCDVWFGVKLGRGSVDGRVLFLDPESSAEWRQQFFRFGPPFCELRKVRVMMVKKSVEVMMVDAWVHQYDGDLERKYEVI